MENQVRSLLPTNWRSALPELFGYPRIQRLSVLSWSSREMIMGGSSSVFGSLRSKTPGVVRLHGGIAPLSMNTGLYGVYPCQVGMLGLVGSHPFFPSRSSPPLHEHSSPEPKTNRRLTRDWTLVKARPINDCASKVQVPPKTCAGVVKPRAAEGVRFFSGQKFQQV